jgi:hypothetical protein
MDCFRQGDVLLVPVDEAPPRCTPVLREAGRLVLAHGEVTGHAHVITDPAAELVSREQAEELFLLVYGDDAVLEHEEHDPIAIPPGAYRVIRQREYAPGDRFVQVVD